MSEHQLFYDKLREQISVFSEKHLKKASGVSEVILLAPDIFVLLTRLVRDAQVPATHKARLAGAIAYFASPVDLIPEVIVGPVGYLDDMVVSVFVLDGLLNDVDHEVVVKHWPGKANLLDMIQQVLAIAREFLSPRILKKLKNKADKGA